MKILLADDEPIARTMLEHWLTGWGYEVITVRDGEAALNALAADPTLRLAIVDWVMPKVDGIEVCRHIRSGPPEPYVYVVLLTAKDDKADIIQGLDAGADDYLVKPFDFGELLARIRALQRRPRGVDAPTISRGSLLLDPVRREVTVGGRRLGLTNTEYNILELLMRRSPAVVDRKAIAEHGWRDETDPLGSNAIDVQLSRLRAKIPSAGVRIVTVRGAGYRLEEA
jgi:two-component system response regulator MprA